MHTATVIARFTAAFLLFWLGACGGEQGQPEPGAGVVPGTAVAHRGGDRAGCETVWTTRVDTVGRGDTFGGLLLRNDVHVEEAGRIVRFVRERKLFSLRRLQPGEPVRVRCRSDGRFQALQYEKGPDEVYVVERDGNSLIGYRTAIAYDLHLRKIEGTVETTVEGALASSAAAAALTIELSTILAYEIDFLTEPRAGDRIRLLVEEKWLDEEFLGFGRIIYAAYEGARVCVQGVCFGTDSAGSAAGIYYTPEGESLARAFLRSPLNYRRISSRFSRRRFHPILRVWRPHLGVDYAAASGTPVVATGGGVVGFAGWNGGFGNQVRIRHGSLYETCYGHLSRFARGLRAGQRVERGQLIGYVGSTGLSTGPHLDFRVKERGTYVDPLSMRNPREEAVPASLQEAFQSHCLRLGCLIDSLAAGAAVVYAPAEPRGGPLTGGEGQHAWRGGSARFRQL